MSRTYYAMRRFCPYMGVIQVVDVGDARAFSTDGEHWQVRIPSGGGPSTMLAALADMQHHDTGEIAELQQAIDQRPGMPFPLEDRFELWLLDKQEQLPLALLKSRRQQENIERDVDTNWQPFLLEERSFPSAILEQEIASRNPKAWPVTHMDLLEKLVNQAARPLPAAQWFERGADGSGLGLEGVRLRDDLAGRRLERDGFPELLVREQWSAERDRQVVSDFHHWCAPMLLAHQDLTDTTRARLEAAACDRPALLMEHYGMYPDILDEEAIEVALVKGRLMQNVAG